MLTRKRALIALHEAGTQNDRAKLTRLIVEAAGRVSYATAIAEFRKGIKWAEFIRARDAAATTSPTP